MPEEYSEFAVKVDKWKGEDSDNDVKDNWDDSDDEEKVQTKAAKAVAPIKPCIPKSENEKEQKKLKEMEKKTLKETIQKKSMSAKQKLDEMLKNKEIQKLEEELEQIREALKEKRSEESSAGEIDCFEPSTMDDFLKLGSMMRKKLENHKESQFYGAFLEDFVRNLVVGSNIETVKRISASVAATCVEMSKANKEKPAKKTKKANLNLKKSAKSSIINEDECLVYSDDQYDDKSDDELQQYTYKHRD